MIETSNHPTSPARALFPKAPVTSGAKCEPKDSWARGANEFLERMANIDLFGGAARAEEEKLLQHQAEMLTKTGRALITKLCAANARFFDLGPSWSNLAWLFGLYPKAAAMAPNHFAMFVRDTKAAFETLIIFLDSLENA